MALRISRFRIDMGANPIKNLGQGTGTTDAARRDEVVLMTGDQTVAGIKTFSSSPIVPTPTTDMQTATKKYIDDSKDTVQTLTNKRNIKRAYTTTSLATLTPEIDTYDMFSLTALAHALDIANHVTSTPTAGACILIDILPDATPRALTYGTNYVALSGVAKPTTTIASKRLQMLFIWLADVSKYTLAYVGQEA